MLTCDRPQEGGKRKGHNHVDNSLVVNPFRCPDLQRFGGLVTVRSRAKPGASGASTLSYNGRVPLVGHGTCCGSRSRRNRWRTEFPNSPATEKRRVYRLELAEGENLNE